MGEPTKRSAPTMPWVRSRGTTTYAWIMAANNVIKQIDASDFATLDATQKSYLGFAYAYRAVFYLDLVRLYEFKENNYTEAPGVLGLGVPIVLPETTEAEAKNNPRAKVDDIYDQVIFPDLDKAEELLSGFTAPDKYTISPALVYGLKARAWLERRYGQERRRSLCFRRRVRPLGH
ncbi:MAG: hypothetical protein ACLUQ6_04895 [Alistipes onderdonkii]